MDKDYVTVDELKGALTMGASGFADVDLTRAVSAASRAIDNVCNRRFYTDDADVDRFYTLSQAMIEIDDLSAAPTSVKVATSAGSYTIVGASGSDYVVEPINALADNRPFTALRALRWWPGYDTRWSRLRGNVKITGKWGWPEVPDQVPQAATILATKLLVRTRQAPFGIVTVGAGDVGVAMRIAREDPDVAFLLDGLIRQEFLA